MVTDSGDMSKTPAPTQPAPYAGQVTPPPAAPAPGAAPPATKTYTADEFALAVLDTAIKGEAVMDEKVAAKDDIVPFDEEEHQAVIWAEEASKE
jgi:hypothetical protein